MVEFSDAIFVRFIEGSGELRTNGTLEGKKRESEENESNNRVSDQLKVLKMESFSIIIK